MTIERMRVNGRSAPMEIDDPTPLLSWAVAEPVLPEAVRVRVLGIVGSEPLWETTVPGDQISVRYGGPTLRAATRYRWTVEAFGTAASFGENWFGTGIAGEWEAAWVGRNRAPWFTEAGGPGDPRPPSAVPRTWRTMYSAPPLQLRRSFDLAGDVVRATLYITARGIYRAALNGIRVGREELAPGWTDYQRLIEYQGFDVTEHLHSGENVLSAEVADGWWSGHIGYNTRRHADQYGDAPQLLAQLVIELAGGSRVVVGTDSRWRELPGFRVSADLLMGEYHDSSLATPGWQSPGFDDSRWRDVVVVTRDETSLIGQRADGTAVVDEVAPVSVSRVGDAYVVDFGQNLTGWVRLRVKGAVPGDVVRVKHGERLDGDAVYTANLRSAEALDILSPVADDEIFEPAFTFHGFQYAQVEGLRVPLRPGDICAVVVSSIRERTGWIESSNPLVDRIVSNAWWSQRGNFLSIPTDCPQRDERLGWTADAQVFAATASYNADVQAFLGRWLDQLNSAQESSGRVPDVVPVPPTSTMFDVGAPGWGDAAVLVPWTLYRMYGDRSLLRRQLPHMTAWVEYVRELSGGRLWSQSLGNNYGDWLSVDADVPRHVVAAAYQIHSATVLADAHTALGDESGAKQYRAYAQTLRDLFMSAFVDDEGRVLGDTQTGYLFVLAWDIAPPERRADIAAHLVRDVEKRQHLTTGFLGVGLLCPVLTSVGRPDLAVGLLLNESYPSWGYSINQGATTMWERWDGWTRHGGFQAVTMNSFNHYSFGSVVEWLYRGVAGIDQQPGSAGFSALLVRPLLDPRLAKFAVRFVSVRGEIRVAWDMDGGWFELEVPPAVTAQLDLLGSSEMLGAGRHRRDLSSLERRG